MNPKIIKIPILFITLLIIILSLNPLSTQAVSGPQIKTTLKDNTIQRGSKKTFDVWAKNSSGAKIKATVKFNGEKIEPNWDDTEKTSYTLTFKKEGGNTVTVSAVSDGGKKKELKYNITYKKAQNGDEIGSAVWSVELFTIGGGYLVYPTAMPIYEGETSAEQLIRLLSENGFVSYYGGTVKSSFYLAYIADGTAKSTKYNNYQKSDDVKNPKKLDITPKIPSLLTPYLKKTMTFFDPDDYKNNWSGYLGEFAFTNGSGWMYCVNNIFPNVGFADSYLSDGDIVRVQYTLGYGADIGGFGTVGTNIPNVDNAPDGGYYTVANKDVLTLAVLKAVQSGLTSNAKIKEAYNSALAVMQTLNATQSSVDKEAANLTSQIENFGQSNNKETTLDPESKKEESKISFSTATDNSSNNSSLNTKTESSEENASVSNSFVNESTESITDTPTEKTDFKAEEKSSDKKIIFIALGIIFAISVGAFLYLKRRKNKNA